VSGDVRIIFNYVELRLSEQAFPQDSWNNARERGYTTVGCRAYGEAQIAVGYPRSI